MKKLSKIKIIIYSFFVIFFVFSMVSCELFGPKTDLYNIISNSVDWANAEKLTVTVYTGDWGKSPQEGEGKCGDTRKGYEFNVEFTSSINYGFEKWLAFPTAGFTEFFEANNNKSFYDGNSIAIHILNGNEVTITEGISETGAKTAKVKIDTLEPVTLVPWCSDKPRVIQTNPPLISSGITYPRGQEIRIVFSSELEYEDGAIPFDEGDIQISGIIAKDGSLLNGHGDLTGIVDSEHRYFEVPVYSESERIISIKPRAENLPPANLIITVTVGTKIKGLNGNELASSVAFSYYTDDREIIKVYQANQIWALHPGSESVPEDPKIGFFYQMADRQLDRRIRRKADGKYAITLYFSVNASSPTDMLAFPDTVDIVELEYAGLIWKRTV